MKPARFSIDEKVQEEIAEWAKTRVPPVSFSAAARHLLSEGLKKAKQDDARKAEGGDR